MKNTKTYNLKKDISFELMRSVACLFVVAIHVYTALFNLFNKVPSKTWLISDIIMSISRFSVPLFIMITGALLLGKDITIRTAVNKATKYLLILIIWSIAYILILKVYLYKQTYSIH